jgi:hypothetical protein
MISSGANPTTCEVLINGKPCGEYSSYVYKTAFATRLVCSGCASAYRAATSKSMTRPPTLEFALMELIPAREVLEMELKMTTERLTATRAQMTAMAALAAQERRLMLRLLVGFVVIGAVVFGALTTFGAPSWALWLPLLAVGFGYGIAEKAVQAFWFKPRAKKINQDFIIARWN